MQRNLTYLAFAATPKPKTLNLFGEPRADDPEERQAFHLCSMRQVIEEGFILDVPANCTTYATCYKLASHSPDDPEVPIDKARADLARFVSLHPSNLEAKARIIVEHFRAKTRGKINGRAKAMIATRSHEDAVRYKQAIDHYIRERGYDAGDRGLHALVAFSGSTTVDGVSYTEAMMNGFGATELPKRFASDECHLLVRPLASPASTGTRNRRE